MGNKKRATAAAILSTLLLGAAANADLYHMDIVLPPDGSHAYKAVAVLPAVLNRSLPDALRVVERESGDEVPYFIYSEEVTATASVDELQIVPTRRFVSGGFYYQDYRVRRAANADPLITHLRLTPERGEFVKDVAVLGSYDDEQWHYVTEGTVYAVADVARDEIALGEVCRYDYYRLEIPTPQEPVYFGVTGLYKRRQTESAPVITASAEAEYEVESSGGVTTVTVSGLKDSGASMLNLNAAGVTVETEGIFNREARAGGVSKRIYRLDFDGYKVSDTYIPLYGGRQRGDTLTVTIYDYDDKPLDISGVTLELAYEYLVFKAEEGVEYALAYGGALQAPVYDIENYAHLIIREGFDIAELSGEARLITAAETERDYRLALNIAIAVAGVALVAVAAAALVRKKGGRNDAAPERDRMLMSKGDE
jgi:hypothetical protein